MELKKDYTIAIVTYNMQQAERMSANTHVCQYGVFPSRRSVECNNTEKLFSIPSDKRTEDYITGRFG